MTKDKNTAFFGHPIALSSLFATEMWERFSYYGMRALLVLFLTATYASGGFGMSELDAFTVYGIFTGLVYVTPIIGGILADKVLGQRKSIYIGGITMAIGQFTLASSAMASGGNNDPRKDGGFTIFYMGINLGAFLSPLIAGTLGEQVAWEYGFMAAGAGMVIGTIWFYLRSHTLGNLGMPPKVKAERNRLAAKDWITILIYSGVMIGAVYAFIFGWSSIPTEIGDWIIKIAALLGLLYLASNIFKGTKGKTEWSRVGVIFILAIANIFFWSGFEQAGSTFNIFARDNTNRLIGNFEIAASAFQGVNAIAIFIFAPVFTFLWSWLDKHRANPNTPKKFAIGMLLLSTGFVVMALANQQTHGGTRLVSPLWLVLVYLLHTWGELCLSPIGLSMVTKLSPAKLVSTMMGVWMGSFAIGNFVASQMKAIVIKFDLPLFWFIAAETAVASLILFAISPFLNKMMKGIK